MPILFSQFASYHWNSHVIGCSHMNAHNLSSLMWSNMLHMWMSYLTQRELAGQKVTWHAAHSSWIRSHIPLPVIQYERLSDRQICVNYGKGIIVSRFLRMLCLYFVIKSSVWFWCFIIMRRSGYSDQNTGSTSAQGFCWLWDQSAQQDFISPIAFNNTEQVPLCFLSHSVLLIIFYIFTSFHSDTRKDQPLDLTEDNLLKMSHRILLCKFLIQRLGEQKNPQKTGQ